MRERENERQRDRETEGEKKIKREIYIEEFYSSPTELSLDTIDSRLVKF